MTTQKTEKFFILLNTRMDAIVKGIQEIEQKMFQSQEQSQPSADSHSSLTFRATSEQKKLLEQHYLKIIDFEQFLIKIFKDWKNTLGGQIIVDLLKVLIHMKQFFTAKNINLSNPQPFIVLGQETCKLIAIRKDLSFVYRSFGFFEVYPTYEESLINFDLILKRTMESFSHTQLNRIQKSLRYEVEVFKMLIKIQISLSSYNFKDCILFTYQAKIMLEQWKQYVQTEQTGISSSGKTVSWAIHWLSQFYFNLISKINIYFQRILKQKEEEFGERLTIKPEVNFAALIESFVAKTDATNVSIIFEVSKLGKNVFHKTGYVCPHPQEESEEILSGLNSWPAVYSFPKDPPIQSHWPNLISVIFQNQEFIDSYGPPYCYFDKKVGVTYFISRIEPTVLLTVIYEKKKDTDNPIRESIDSISATLRNFKLFEELRN